jgi:hypothetical protein
VPLDTCLPMGDPGKCNLPSSVPSSFCGLTSHFQYRYARMSRQPKAEALEFIEVRTHCWY